MTTTDSNVLLYAASGRPVDATKAARARQILREDDVVISFQVLQAFYANAVHLRKLALNPAQAAVYCGAWLMFTVVPLGAGTVVRTLEIATRYQISNGDDAILAASIESRCPVVYSEDLSHGQDDGGVRVVNPFRP